MKTIEQHIAKGWTMVQCHSCDGHGMVADYGCGEDFYGPEECRTCNGSGNIWKTPKGRYAEYPGGRYV
jgi:DnaJ-class molecular chaperone